MASSTTPKQIASTRVDRRLRGKPPPPHGNTVATAAPLAATNAARPLPAPRVTMVGAGNSYYTDTIELFWPGEGRTPMQVLGMEWFTTQPRAHKYSMDLDESGLPFHVSLNIVWLVAFPSKQTYNQLHGLNMVPLCVAPGCTSLIQLSLAHTRMVIRQHIDDQLGQCTELEASGWILKAMKSMEILTHPAHELFSPWAGNVIALGIRYMELPKTLDAKHCLIHIQSRDNSGFQ